MNTESELIKNVHDSPTKQIDPKLKGSVTCLIRSEQAKLLNVECGSVELTSDIGSARTAATRTLLSSCKIACATGSSSSTGSGSSTGSPRGGAGPSKD